VCVSNTDECCALSGTVSGFILTQRHDKIRSKLPFRLAMLITKLIATPFPFRFNTFSAWYSCNTFSYLIDHRVNDLVRIDWVKELLTGVS